MTNTKSIAPQKFIASIGGYTGPSYYVQQVSQNTVEYKFIYHGSCAPEDIVTKIFQVSDEKWKFFFHLLDDARFLEWEKEYRPEPEFLIMDGTGWMIEIESTEINMQSCGSNSYPPKDLFDKLKQAVVYLIDGNEFL